MTEIQNIETALSIFEEAATKHAETTEKGDYKGANKKYDIVVEAAAFLKERNEVDKLLDFLTHASVGVRMAAATYLLATHEKEAIKVLLQVSRGHTCSYSRNYNVRMEERESVVIAIGFFERR